MTETDKAPPKIFIDPDDVFNPQTTFCTLAYESVTTEYTRTDLANQQVRLEKQPYTYIGKDGRPVLARDLEDQLDLAKTRIAELERALSGLKYWFDADPEVLDAMSADELADHTRQSALIEAALIDAALITDDKLNG